MTRATGSEARSKTSARRRLLTAIICLAMMGVACSEDAGSQSSGTRPWSSLPRTLGCVITDQGGDVAPPLAGQIEQVTFRHSAGDRLSLAFDFRGGKVPQDPEAVTNRYGGVSGTPGSLAYSALVRPLIRNRDSILHITSPEPAVDKGWEASLGDAPLPISVTASGRTLIVTVDLSRGAKDGFLDHGRFKADVDVGMMVRGSSPLDTDPDGPYFVKAQRCPWSDVNSSPSSRTQVSTSPTSTSQPQQAIPSAPVPADGLDPPQVASATPIPQYVRTQSGKVRCAVSPSGVACQRQHGEVFTTAPIYDGYPAGQASVLASGAFQWVSGQLPAIQDADPRNDLVLTYGQAKQVGGWTIVPDSGGTTFTNTQTGHGMFVNIDKVLPF